MNCKKCGVQYRGLMSIMINEHSGDTICESCHSKVMPAEQTKYHRI